MERPEQQDTSYRGSDLMTVARSYFILEFYCIDKQVLDYNDVIIFCPKKMSYIDIVARS
jgi:hypothetical protein